MPSLRPVAAVRTGSNRAASTKTSVVASVQPVASPPMTPPRLSHPRPVGDHGHLGVERVFLTVQREQGLARPRQADRQIALEPAGVEHMQRPVEIEGQKIGDVDQCRDRPQSDRLRAGGAANRGLAGCGRRAGGGRETAGRRNDPRCGRRSGSGNGRRPGSCRAASDAPSPDAARSRAMPRTPRQSARFGVTLMSMTASPRPSRSA